MTLDEAKKEMVKFVELKTTLRPAFVDVILKAEEVVRCKDCKHYSADGWGYGNCNRPNVDYLRMNDNGFCSWGERREDVQESD